MERNLEAVAQAICAAQTIALCSHVSPDGDTIGSGLALKYGLEQLGKQVTLFVQDKVPNALHVLPGHELYLHADAPEARAKYDLLLAVDVSDAGRMGDCSVLLEHCTHNAQIDHHGTNPMYCEVNAVDSQAPAVGVLVYDLLTRVMGLTITGDIAKCLYAAICTDTGNFAYSSTNAETFRVMASLMECGLPLSEMNRTLFMEKSRAQVLLLQRALSTLTFTHNGEVTSMKLSQKDFEECGALPEHADTIVNYGRNIIGVKMAALIREDTAGNIKVALRSVGSACVNDIAKSFGGGGYAQASGCTMHGTLDECRAKVVAAMEAELG